MASITILNSSGSTISFTLIYNLKNENNSIEKFSRFFSTIQYKTIEYPDDSINVNLMIRIEKDGYIPMWASSLIFDKAVTKYYEFIVDSNYKYGLFEIPSTKLSNLNFINLKNKTYTKIKSTLTFNVGKEFFTQNNSIIKKNRSLYILMPINAKNINLSILTFNSLKNSWSNSITIESISSSINKYCEISSDIFNSSFKLKYLI